MHSDGELWTAIAFGLLWGLPLGIVLGALWFNNRKR